ncbi:MAG: leucine-rich repeat domain-containing protein, partial [Rhodoluna sp.]|nr:leucine-rich repeat domain-containing protein [Rhodoluna sp.]
MLARSAKQDGKYRKIVTVLTTLVLAMSGLALSPAHATVIPSNGTYLCTSGEASDLTPNFTITNGVVTTGASCAGAVVIPEGVTTIGYQAFQYSGLDSIKIPASITTIQQEAFSFTNSLTSITVDGANPNYSSADGVLFNKDSSTLINYPAGKTGTSYTIPASVTTIGDGAFVVATSLGSITVPASVTSIGTSAFYNATALTTVTFESGSQLTTIGIYAFDSASALTSITIPASVTSIGEWAFANATKLASVYFLGNAPTSVGNMPFLNVADGAKAIVRAADTSYLVDADNKWNGLIVELDYTLTDGFYLCSTGVLTTTGTPTYRVLDGEVSSGGSCAGAVVIPEGVTSIGTDAFNGATALTSITIPASVTSIGTSAFYNATELTTVTFESGSKLTSIGTDAFARATALTSITIPASVTSIGTSAFYNATALTTVTFESGSQLTTISGYLFGLATALEGITIPASVETIGNFAFYNATALTTVTFESGSQLTT